MIPIRFAFRRPLLLFTVCLTGLFLLVHGSANAEDWPGEPTDFHGFTQYDFTVNHLVCKVVEPRHAAAGKPWIWRARFFGHQPNVDIALLQKGFHVAYVDVAGQFGSPQAVEQWNDFYQFLTVQKGLAKKPALEGMSRGGMMVFNWAAQNPAKVACIYADAPVCDFKSWPGGYGQGKGDKRQWNLCLKAYGMTEAEALKYQANPMDQLKPLAEAGVPLLHVVGDADQVVPVSENTAIVKSRYQKLGGEIEVISKPGLGHHPHGLKDPAPIVNFIMRHAAMSSQPLRVACVGDSITFGATIKDRTNKSYPAQLGRMLGERYEVKNFGVSGTTMLKKGNHPYWKSPKFKAAQAFHPDIVIIKLGTNDTKSFNWVHQEEYVGDYVAMIESFRALPSAPEVLVCLPVPGYPANFGISDKVIREEVLPQVGRVAKQAGVPVIDLYQALSGKPEMFPDKIHPNAEGAKLIAETIAPFVRSLRAH